MSQLISFAKGSLTIISIIWILTCITLAVVTNVWVGTTGFIILILPFAFRGYNFLNNYRKIEETKIKIERTKNILMSLQGFGIACWLFDVGTTLFALKSPYNVESNPLGWPLGSIVGLVAYVPSSLAVYLLLFKIKSESKLSFLIASFIIVFSFVNVFLNLNAGMNNFGLFAWFVGSDSSFMLSWLAIAITIGMVNVIAIKISK